MGAIALFKKTGGTDMTPAKFLRAIILAALAIVPVTAMARDAVPIIDYVDTPIVTTTGQPVTSAQVANAITAAAVAYKWDVAKSPSQELLVATLRVNNKHTVIVSIPYSPQSFSINYQDSINMKFSLAANTGGYESPDMPKRNNFDSGTRLIHPYYNKWVQQLRSAILSELRRL
jgi:hypothetical protein